MLLALTMLACEGSNIPSESQQFSVTVTSAEESDGNYTETFDYYVALEGSSITLFIGEAAFARGTWAGCDITYQSVVFGQARDAGDVKWQLVGQASVENASGDPCVDGDDDWAGTEYAEIVASEDESIEVGTIYEMNTAGSFVGEVP